MSILLILVILFNGIHRVRLTTMAIVEIANRSRRAPAQQHPCQILTAGRVSPYQTCSQRNMVAYVHLVYAGRLYGSRFLPIQTRAGTHSGRPTLLTLSLPNGPTLEYAAGRLQTARTASHTWPSAQQ
jgi:hypothetical protein